MRIIQLLDALDYGDGVSNDVIHQHELLDEMGVENQIYSKWYNERVSNYTREIDTYRPEADDLVLYHFSGKTFIIDQVSEYPGKRILRYHNVTPPAFFKDSNPQAYQNCKEGLEQLCAHLGRFDGFCADSPFNRSDLISYGASLDAVDVLPIAMDLERLDSVRETPALAEQLRKRPYILFVGRVAPNKCFEDILSAFETYYRYYDQETMLYLVGNCQQSDSYTASIMEQVSRLHAKEKIVFTGKVSDEDLYTYYRGASAFLCMSEHEGFCIPLLEAMVFDIPVIAYDSCAVPDTMGGSGILLRKKDPALTAGLLHELMTDASLRENILAKQRENVALYRHDAMKRRLSTLIEKWEATQ